MECNIKSDVFTKEFVEAKLNCVQKLLESDEKCNTQNEPYKIKYQAIEILKMLKPDEVDIQTDTSDEKKEILLGIVHLQLGLLYSDTEELKAGEEQFMKCLEVLKDKELDPEAVLLVVDALNQLGVIWYHWNQPTKVKTFLERAEQIYHDFTNIGGICKYYVKVPLFGIKKPKTELTPQEIFEKLNIRTLYFLAQLYKSLNDHHKSAIYCHLTLRRQLGHNAIAEDLDYIEWVLNTATLSQYFIVNNNFPLAKHNLAAASYILELYKYILNAKVICNGYSEESEAEMENFKHRSADVARCWAKYGIALLSFSKQRLLKETETEQENCHLDNKESSKPKIIEDLKFDILEKKIEPIARQVTDKCLLDFDDARLTFLNVKKWLKVAQLYYTLEDHASDHVSIVQDISEAYRYLAFFEEHEDRQVKMHKKRINVLENVIKELNPRYYKKACMQIWIELGETYSHIIDIKFDRLQSLDEKQTQISIKKINRLVKNSIKNFQSFIDSLGIRTSDSEIRQFPDDVLRPALMAYIHVGRLYTKILLKDDSTRQARLNCIQSSYNAYKFVIDYCEKYPDAADVIRVELKLCKELINLQPIQIRKLKELGFGN
ncbi:KIF-binding protein [Colletes latitarsis]|uniref:KIF-binding protein n=1 Tax=Colletes latitarsis TaxID=2605962 RepID=UPI004035833B